MDILLSLFFSSLICGGVLWFVNDLTCSIRVLSGFFYLILFFVGVPPLVSRRVLETLTYLARNHPYVAKILLQFRLPLPTVQVLRNIYQSRGKALMTEEQREGYVPIALLLSLLNQPLYLRSIAHLEQVISDNPILNMLGKFTTLCLLFAHL